MLLDSEEEVTKYVWMQNLTSQFTIYKANIAVKRPRFAAGLLVGLFVREPSIANTLTWLTVVVDRRFYIKYVIQNALKNFLKRVQKSATKNPKQ